MNTYFPFVKEALTYDDVLLVPQISNIKSRKEIDLSTNLCSNIRLTLPVISSPMDTVSESAMATAMYKHGGLGVIHRYNTIEKQTELVRTVSENNPEAPVAAATGVAGDFLDRAVALVAAGATIICIDVAHGHHVLMKRALTFIKDAFGESVHLMAGNVATREGFEDLAEWGADSVRCNVGGGSICSTRIQTGHGVPGLQTIIDCARSGHNAAIIADGGLRNSGDIVKALAAGADAVMLGSMLAGTNETPGTVVTAPDGQQYKLYRGMASKEAQVEWRGEYSSNEGVSTKIPIKGPVDDVLTDLRNGIASGLSYSGARNLTSLWTRAKWVRQPPAGQKESKTHILPT